MSTLCLLSEKKTWEGNIRKGVKGFLLLEVHVMRPLPSPIQVQSTTIQP